jgi:4'-phosphopantetheinyl transferase
MLISDAADVDGFWMEIPETSSLTPKLLNRLTPPEQSRAKRFVRARDQHLFVLSHAMLHHALAVAAGARNCAFREAAHGRPEIEYPAEFRHVRFSLTHTAGMAACVVAPSLEIGIDAEIVRPDLDVMALAGSEFTAREFEELAQLPPGERIDRFYRLWTLKEAVTKALGYGLQMPMHDFSVALSPLAISFSDPWKRYQPGWHLAEKTVATSHKIATAVRDPDAAARRVVWQRVTVEELLPASDR